MTYLITALFYLMIRNFERPVRKNDITGRLEIVLVRVFVFACVVRGLVCGVEAGMFVGFGNDGGRVVEGLKRVLDTCDVLEIVSLICIEVAQ